MTPHQWSKVVVFAVAAALGLFDLYMAVRYGREATISVVLIDVTREYPIIGFALGVLAGHLFWPLKV